MKPRAVQKYTTPKFPILSLFLNCILSQHAVMDRSLFREYTADRRTVSTPYGSLVAEGVGTIILQVVADKKSFSFQLRDCLHIPNFSRHLLSIPRLLQMDLSVILSQPSPHVLFGHKRCLTDLNLPKYLPLICIKGNFYLKGTIVTRAPGLPSSGLSVPPSAPSARPPPGSPAHPPPIPISTHPIPTISTRPTPTIPTDPSAPPPPILPPRVPTPMIAMSTFLRTPSHSPLSVPPIQRPLSTLPPIRPHSRLVSFESPRPQPPILRSLLSPSYPTTAITTSSAYPTLSTPSRTYAFRDILTYGGVTFLRPITLHVLSFFFLSFLSLHRLPRRWGCIGPVVCLLACRRISGPRSHASYIYRIPVLVVYIIVLSIHFSPCPCLGCPV